MRNLKRITAGTYKMEIMSTIQKWRQGSDNDELVNLANKMIRLIGYMAALEMAEDAFDDAIDAANAEAYRQKQDNWELRKQNTELKKQLENYGFQISNK